MCTCWEIAIVRCKSMTLCEKHDGKAQEVQLRAKVVNFDFVMTFYKTAHGLSALGIKDTLTVTIIGN